ncbi:UPF0488 protein C8orf33 homolog isoform X2 [Ambystoma mexicanum]|uniref:UPF0488 protein C8orf33 homolog isoform X2 n=1 Tax=Ambystoma mexicanum TaxID=8296 RepID=UPI0037E71FD2
MEEAPEGTFQDDLDWCIQQLETGLLRQNPTPQQAIETTSMLVQEGQPQTSASIAYRKCTNESSKKAANLFSPTDNSFRFCFNPHEEEEENIPSNCEIFQPDRNVKEKASGCTASSLNQSENVTSGLNRTATVNSGSGFSFNFSVPQEVVSWDEGLETKKETPSSFQLIEQEGLSQDNGACTEGNSNSPIHEMAVASSQNDEQPLKTNEGIPKKKKKKPLPDNKKPKPTEVRKEGQVTPGNCSSQLGHQSKEVPEPGDEQLRREVDWCIEQLELGLKRQKSTQKQADEVLRAVKTLRSEKAALVKKRQIMRAMLGDYRKKMEEERGKQLRLLQAATKSARVAEVKEDVRKGSSHVYRKCAEKSPNETAPARSEDPSVAPGCSAEATTAQVQLMPEVTRDSNTFTFTSSKADFCFNFF